MAPHDELDSLRQELDEWRRRAEVAEAIAAERLARAETGERALRAAEARADAAEAISAERLARAEAAERAVRGGQAAMSNPAAAGPPTGGITPLPDPPPAPAERRPASLLERWRRYTDSLN